jgi:ribokinase
MTVDVVCVGPPFLDLIFRGLPALPVPGEEQLAEELVIVPGAMANVAFALERLGLSAAVCAPVGQDPAGRLLQELMAEAGVRWVGRPSDTTPVSVALPAAGDRAFVTASPPPSIDVSALADLRPRAVVVDLPSIDHVDAWPTVYAVVGDPEVRLLAGNLPASLAGIRALIVNDREARVLAGTDDLEEAARRLASLGTTVVVTCARAGAIATEPSGSTTRMGTAEVDVADSTGAGDLFTAAYVWADLAGKDLDERLELATRYASLSLIQPAKRQKGITLEEFGRVMAERSASGSRSAPGARMEES